jgi:hypothetical protein
MTTKKPRPFGILEFFAHGGDKARARFEKWIDKSYHPMGCWIWTGCTSTSVYAKNFPASFRFPMKLGDKNYRPSVARIAWSLKHNIEFPYELLACHTCDNQRCVNPDHIWVGDIAQNNHDAIRKGRRGLSYEKREELARLYLQGTPYREINKIFNLRTGDLLRAPDMIRKYGMTLVNYRRKLIAEGKLAYSPPVAKGPRKYTPENRLEFAQLYLDGLSLSQIGRRFNLSTPLIAASLRHPDVIEHYGESPLTIKKRMFDEQGKPWRGRIPKSNGSPQHSKLV